MATTLLYEGAPAYPDKTHPWEIIAENEVTQFYTTPICPVDVYLAPELPRTYSGGVLR